MKVRLGVEKNGKVIFEGYSHHNSKKDIRRIVKNNSDEV